VLTNGKRLTASASGVRELQRTLAASL
jgi:hypothetical protein